MALHTNFPKSPLPVPEPDQRWFPADHDLRETAHEKLLPPLVGQIRHEVQDWRQQGYPSSQTSRALLAWWYEREHLIEQADGSLAPFQYYFAQHEAVEIPQVPRVIMMESLTERTKKAGTRTGTIERWGCEKQWPIKVRTFSQRIR